MRKKIYSDEVVSGNQLEYDITYQGMSVTDAAKKHHKAPATVRKLIKEGGWVKVAKVCVGCSKIRSLQAFPRDSRARDGRDSLCKACRSPLGEVAISIAIAREDILADMRAREKAVTRQQEDTRKADIIDP